MSKTQYPENFLVDCIRKNTSESLREFKEYLETYYKDRAAKKDAFYALNLEVMPAVRELLYNRNKETNNAYLDALFEKDTPIAYDSNDNGRFVEEVVNVLKYLSPAVAKILMNAKGVQKALEKELDASTRDTESGGYQSLIDLMKDKDYVAMAMLYGRNTQRAFLTNKDAAGILEAHPEVMKMAAEVINTMPLCVEDAIRVNGILVDEVKKINPNFPEDLKVFSEARSLAQSKRDEDVRLRQAFADHLNSNNTLKRKDLIASGLNIEAPDAKSNTLAEVAKVMSGGWRKTDADLVNEIRGNLREFINKKGKIEAASAGRADYSRYRKKTTNQSH